MIQLPSVNALQKNWLYVPCNGNKAPIGNNWQNQPFTLDRISEIFGKTYLNRPVCSVGLITGELTGTVALDLDGFSASEKLRELTGLDADAVIGSTFSVTSGKPGRSQSFFTVPKEYHRYLATRKIQAGAGEQIELRWNGCQSVVLGRHPETGSYQWLSDPSAIDQAPMWLLTLMTRFDCGLGKDRGQWSDCDFALSYLQALKTDRAVDYDQWLRVGMSLHSIDSELFWAWDLWSMAGENYGRTKEKWASFKRSNSDRSLGIGSIAEWAKQDGWRGKSPQSHQAPQQEDFESIKTEIDLLMRLDQNPRPAAIFPDSLVTPIAGLAKRLNLPTEVYLAALLPVCGSLLNPNIRLLLDDSTKYVVPGILWLGIVGESGVKKSPLQRALLSPLIDLQSEAEQGFELALEQYQSELTQWENSSKDEKREAPKPTAPIPHEFFMADYTMEALAETIKNQADSGFLIFTEELARFFTSMDAYRNGRGGDRQQWLSFYDGGPFKVSRKTTGRVYRKHTNLPILGSIQPSVIKKIMEDDQTSEDGLWSRFAWVYLPLTISPGISKTGGHYKIDEILGRLYRGLGYLGANTFSLASDAIDVWNDWNFKIESKILKEPSGLLRATYPKAKERAARIALLSHLIIAVMNNQRPSDEISAQTLANAIEFTEWLCSETRLLYTQLGICDHPETAKILAFVRRFQGCGWINARMTIHWHSSKDKPSASKAREFMARVVSLGYAVDNHCSPTESKYQIKISDSPTWNNTVTNPPETFAAQGFEPVTPSDNNPVTVVTNSDQAPQVFTDNVQTSAMLLPELPTVIAGSNSIKPSQDKTYKTFATVLPEADDSALQSESTAPGLDEQKTPQVYSPRQAIIHQAGKIEVDESKLDLDWEPERKPQAWEPKRIVKPWSDLSKLYLDIETTGLSPQSERVIMIGVVTEKDGQAETQCFTNPDEAALLQALLQVLKEAKPECLIGHNLFSFDLPFIMQRCEVQGISHPFKRGDKLKTISASSVNGQPISFTPITYGKTQILDTYHQVAIWDKSAAKLMGYGLKDSVITLGLRTDRRLELGYQEILQCWENGNLDRIQEYLVYDLEDTKLLADFLLPVVVQQSRYVPRLSLQDLATASPALKAQMIHQALLPGVKPEADEPVQYKGASITCWDKGLFRDVAKIDVSSLYPSLMLRYGLCSRKDTESKFLDVLNYMVKQRLELKGLAKQGNIQADHEQNALKILINGSYGFFGTGGYGFNDYECSALVTGYGRKILKLMESIIEAEGGVLIESDTDGVMFRSTRPQIITKAVQSSLADGINIELEFSDCGLYLPKAKSYVIVYPSGKTTVKGLFRKRDRYPLANEFPVEFLKQYFLNSPDCADGYYQDTLERLGSGNYPIHELTITRKIRNGETTLVSRGLGNVGDKVSYYYTEPMGYCKSKKYPIEAATGPYWIEHYQAEITAIYQEITGKSNEMTLLGGEF